jgi:hypothetical protein
MKKLLFAIIGTALVVGGFFYACKKENHDVVNKTTSEIKIQKKDGNGWRVFVADCKGALSGAGTGAAVGAAVGGQVGAGIGAIAGGVVGGAAASVEKALDLKKKDQETNTTVAASVESSSLFPPPTDTVNIDEMTSQASYSNNPFDYIGASHYKLINYCVENQHLIINNGELNRDAYYEMAMNVLPIFVESASSSYSSYYNFEAMITTLSMVDLPFEDYLSPELSDILNAYNAYSETSESFSDFYQYSVIKENEILSCSFLTEIEKQKVLSYMATARYGYWYWTKVLD